MSLATMEQDNTIVKTYLHWRKACWQAQTNKLWVRRAYRIFKMAIQIWTF